MEAFAALSAGALAGCASWLLTGEGTAAHAVAVSPEGTVRRMCAYLGGVRAVRAFAAMPIAAAALEDSGLFGWAGTSRDERSGCAVLSLLAAAAGGFVLTSSWVGGVAAPCGLSALAAVRASQARARRASLLETAMPDVFRMLSTAMGSGSSLPQAIRYVGENAEEPVASAFAHAALSIECGVPVSDVLDEVLADLRAPGLELVVSALKISQRTGAPMKELLAEASEVVASRVELRRDLDVKTAQARLSARVVALMPLVMLAFLMLVSADFQRGVATVPGACSVLVALVLDGAAWVVIRRIMAVEL